MYKFVLIRHGESIWNLENRFTGWADVDLTPTGIKQAQAAGRLLVEGLGVRGGGRDVGVTGSLVRAGGELELVGRLQVGVAGRAVGGGVVLEVEEKGEHAGNQTLSCRHKGDNQR